MTDAVVHLNTTPAQRGYIKVRPQTACGIEDKLNEVEMHHVMETWTPFFRQVTCDWCRVLHNQSRRPGPDERVVNMTFHNNKPMSAHDTEKAIAEGVEKGIQAGLDKIASDFYESEAVGQNIRSMVKQAVLDILSSNSGQTQLTRAVRTGRTSDQDQALVTKKAIRELLKEGSVRQQLVEIIKIADDEIEDEFDDSGEAERLRQERKDDAKAALREVLLERPVIRDSIDIVKEGTLQVLESQLDSDDEGLGKVKEAVREVLQEQQGAGVGTQFVQNIYAEALDPANTYRQTKNLITAGDVIEDFPKSELTTGQMHTIVSEALQEFFEDDDDSLEEERLNIHRAFRDMMELPGFQLRIKEMVKTAIAEDRQEELNRTSELHRKMWDQINAALSRSTSAVLETPATMHYKPLYCTVACGADTTYSDVTRVRSKVDCQACKIAASITI